MLVVADTTPLHYLVLTDRMHTLPVLGTLAILDAAASRGLIDIHEKIALLRTTTFRVRGDLLEALLERQRQRGAGKLREP